MTVFVVVEPIVKGKRPIYCVHGRTKCIACGRWCWLGSRTIKALQSGVAPVCLICAQKHADPRNRIGRIDDSAKHK